MEVNWREKRGKKLNDGELDWRFYLQIEFVEFIEEVDEIAEIFDWDLWGGGVNNYAVTLSQGKRDGKSISIRINPGDNYYYYVSFERQWNPNNIDNNKYLECIAKTKEEAIAYLKNFLKNNQYIREFKNERISILGGAYDRYYFNKIKYDSLVNS